MISKKNYKQQISVKVWTVSFYSFTVSGVVYRGPVPEFVFKKKADANEDIDH